MSLYKAIEHGKEHRRQYGTKGERYAKLVDKTCRNHGGRSGGSKKQCEWCLGNRLYSTIKRKGKADYEGKN